MKKSYIVLPDLSRQVFFLFLQPVSENHKRNDRTRVKAIEIRLNQFLKNNNFTICYY